MPESFQPRTEILPPAQQAIWAELAPARALSFVLYGGTAIALHLGHRVSVDFDFFSAENLDKAAIVRTFSFMAAAETVQDEVNTFVIRAPGGPEAVKISFFGGLNIGRINQPLMTDDGVLAVASREDLLATKLKAILDRAEAKDYRDIAALLMAGVSLERGLAGFVKMFGKDVALPLRALGYFNDGDLTTLSDEDRAILKAARDRITSVPETVLQYGSLIGS